MRIFRFDPELSVPISAFGSDFRICPMVDCSGATRVEVMHLGPGGRVGRHPAAAAQLFAVLAGEGWVGGAGGARHAVRAGVAALFEPGEEHEAHSDHGLTAVVIEGAFSVQARSVTTDIVVVDYDTAWTDWFEELRRLVWPQVRDVALRVEHVGSTSVAGLAAKPIIDIDVVVAAEGQIRPVISALARLGYRWQGDLGVPGRQAFRPSPEIESELPAHHLYVVVDGSRPYLDHVLLRDLLRSDASARSRYAALKRRNAELAGGDIDVYLAAKAGLVGELLARARDERGLPAVEYWSPEVELEPWTGLAVLPVDDAPEA